jgi:2-keto-4-pentenoate hydratase/2-oxohepta-3-ene-1,7-dioic acid hydratase in catechol pathway
VLSLPFALRFLLATDPQALTEVLGIVYRAISGYILKKARLTRSGIAGYTVCNDATVRDWLQRSPTATLGKSFDTHGPIGPWLTTGLTVEQAEDLEIRTWVNSELRQHGRTSDFIYGIRQMIEELSRVFTLEPADILATGTLAGVGAGMTPPQFLQIGDRVRVEIEGLGAIDNPVIAEPVDHMPFGAGRAD